MICATVGYIDVLRWAWILFRFFREDMRPPIRQTRRHCGVLYCRGPASLPVPLPAGPSPVVWSVGRSDRPSVCRCDRQSCCFQKRGRILVRSPLLAMTKKLYTGRTVARSINPLMTIPYPLDIQLMWSFLIVFRQFYLRRWRQSCDISFIRFLSYEIYKGHEDTMKETLVVSPYLTRRFAREKTFFRQKWQKQKNRLSSWRIMTTWVYAILRNYSR